MKIGNIIKAAVALSFTALIAYGATKGDPSPFAKNGVNIVRGWDGGTGAPVCLGIPNQNSLMVRNWQGDGGTSATLFCGFENTVTAGNGMPLQNTETLTVDMVSVTQGITAVIPSNLDGGATQTAGSAKPQLCCIGAAGSAPVDLRWMIVK